MDIQKFEDKIKLPSKVRKEFEAERKKIGKQLFEKLQKRITEDAEIKKQLLKRGRKKFIEDSVTVYRANYNTEYLDHCKYIKQLRNQQINKFGASADKSFRLVFKLPAKFYSYLNRFLDPPFPENDKESNWFARKYKEFCVAERL